MAFASVALLGGKKQPTKFNIIGFPKCGQVSMQKYLIDRYSGYNTRRDELIWKKSGVEEYEKMQFDNLQTIIMIRDPVKACWSNYWYMYNAENNMDYKKFLTTPSYHDQLGEENPISCYNFNKWIKRFLKFNPIIVELEHIRENSNFPTLNTTPTSRPYVKETFHGKMPEMTEEQISLTKKLLEKEIKEQKEASWSIDYF